MASPPGLSALVRRVKPEKIRSAIIPRALSALQHISQVPATSRTRVLLDTNIYIDNLAGRLPPEATAILDVAILHHCSVCLGEIATGLAARDVTAARWPKEVAAWSAQMTSMSASRIHTPDRDVWLEAGLVAGTIARVQGYQKEDLRKALNDALVYLTARKAGVPVMTKNREDFDRMEQVAPGGTVFYIF